MNYIYDLQFTVEETELGEFSNFSREKNAELEEDFLGYSMKKD